MASRARGIPVCIYRPGMITGHSQTGVTNTDDLMCRLLKGFIQMGSAPDLDLFMDMIPVDYVSRAIVHLSRQKESLGKVFHLVNQEPLHLSKIIQEINSLGYPVQQISYEKWQANLISVSKRSEENALISVLPLVTEKNYGQEKTYLENSSMGSQAFDCQNTLEGLVGTSIVCPPVDVRLLSTYFNYFVSSNFLHTVAPLLSQT